MAAPSRAFRHGFRTEILRPCRARRCRHKPCCMFRTMMILAFALVGFAAADTICNLTTVNGVDYSGLCDGTFDGKSVCAFRIPSPGRRVLAPQVPDDPLRREVVARAPRARASPTRRTPAAGRGSRPSRPPGSGCTAARRRARSASARRRAARRAQRRAVRRLWRE